MTERADILAYVVMPDHVHFLSSAGENGLPELVRRFKGISAKLLRERHGLYHAWQKSFFDHIIRSQESLEEKCEYIRQNPVRRKLVMNANDYAWLGSVLSEKEAAGHKAPPYTSKAAGHKAPPYTFKIQKLSVLITVFFGTLILSGVSTTLLAELSATATLQPAEITQDQAAQLDVVIEGAATAGVPSLSVVDGLEFTHFGHSTQLQFVNGKMSGGVTHRYRVTANRMGSFTIPAIKVKAGGKILETQPVILRVGKGAGSYSVPTVPSTQGGSQPTNPPAASPAQGIPPEIAVLRLDHPKRDFYVGELVPVDIKACFRQGIEGSLNSLPSLSGSAFTLGNLGNQPEKTSENIKGIPYTVFTWRTAVAAVKSGEHPLGTQIEFTLIVRSRTRRKLDPFDNDLFGDPFFDSFFGSVEEKKVELRSPEETVKILPLPKEGRPSDFSGAIGQFQISTSASPTQVAAGDPVTLKTTVLGTGNFDRLPHPVLESSPQSRDWKTYPPSSKFEPTDATGYAGQKIFEQVIIPQKTDLKNIPAIKLSCFDPEARRYVTLSSAAIPIQISGAAPVTLNFASSPQRSHSRGADSQHLEDLVPNKVKSGHLRRSLTPVILNPWFWGVQSLPLLALGLTWVAARRWERLSGDPLRTRALAASRAVRAQLGAMDAALRDRDTAAFFSSARRVLQERFGERWNLKPEIIALSDLETRLPGDLPLTHDARKVFETADAVAYSGQTYSSEALNEWKKAVLEILKGLEKK